MFCQEYLLPLLNVEKYARLFICLFSIVWPIKCNFCCWITLLLFCTWRGHYDGYWKFSCLLPNIATAFNAIWQGELGNSNCIALIHKKFADMQLIGKFCCLHEKCVYIFFYPTFQIGWSRPDQFSRWRRDCWRRLRRRLRRRQRQVKSLSQSSAGMTQGKKRS